MGKKINLFQIERFVTKSNHKPNSCMHTAFSGNWQLIAMRKWPKACTNVNDMQKKILLMIQNMQQPAHYHGFGIAFLNLEAFAKVRSIDAPFLEIPSQFLFYIFRLFGQFVATT